MLSLLVGDDSFQENIVGMRKFAVTVSEEARGRGFGRGIEWQCVGIWFAWARLAG